MAIVKMKKIRLLALNQDRAKLLKQLQKLGCVEIIQHEEDELDDTIQLDENRLEEVHKLVNRMDLAILRLAPYDQHKKKLLDLRPVAGEDQVASALAARRDLLGVVERLEEIERTRGKLRARATRDQAQIDQLRPWENLDIPLDQIQDTQTVSLTLFTLPARAWDAFLLDLSGIKAQSVERVSQESDIIHAFAAVHRSEEEAFDDALKRAGATRVAFADLKGTVLYSIEQLKGKIARTEEIKKQLDDEVKTLADHLPMLRILRDVDALERDRLESAGRFYATQSAFLLTGWAPEHREQELVAAVKKVSPTCEVEFEDAAEGEQPPTQLQNNSAVTPFETIVKMFATPDPNGIDPTAMMMPFWACFFGMMVSDAGYGIVVFLVMWFVSKKLKRQGSMGKMTFVLAIGGLATIFWGALYGGWFSIEGIPAILFAPMDKPLEMMILCMGLGVVQIFTGMGIAMYMSIKRGRPWDAICDQGFWILLLVGLGLLLVNTMVGGIMAGIGFLGILFTAGRGKSKNPLKRLMSGLGALYGITSYVSDILSYARLFGMGLATGVIGMVFNTLAGMLMGSPVGMVFAVIILVVGHTFNLGINALGAYVHSCRLQYIEFFNKFYESGGRDFMPLEQKTKYVDIVENEA